MTSPSETHRSADQHLEFEGATGDPRMTVVKVGGELEVGLHKAGVVSIWFYMTMNEAIQLEAFIKDFKR